MKSIGLLLFLFAPLGSVYASGPSAAERQTLSEIYDLQAKIQHQSLVLKAQEDKLTSAKNALNSAQVLRDQTLERRGTGTAEGQRMETRLLKARQSFYAALNRRDFLRYQLRTLEQAVQERRLSLGYEHAAQEARQAQPSDEKSPRSHSSL